MLEKAETETGSHFEFETRWDLGTPDDPRPVILETVVVASCAWPTDPRSSLETWAVCLARDIVVAFRLVA
jgi:hypothetical protein